MSWIMREVAALRRELRDYVDQRVGNLYGWTLTASSSSMGDKDQVQTGDEPVSAPEADIAPNTQTQRPARRLEVFGHRSVPPQKLRSFWFRLGSSNVVYFGIAPSGKYGPQDLDVGESALFNAAKALVRLWKTGKLTIDAADADGVVQDVVVQGGNAKVGRVGDDVDVGSLSVSLDITGVVQAVLWTPPGGGPPVTIATAPAVTAITGKISTGAPNFKG